jgi:hypothetical protein
MRCASALIKSRLTQYYRGITWFDSRLGHQIASVFLFCLFAQMIGQFQPCSLVREVGYRRPGSTQCASAHIARVCCIITADRPGSNPGWVMNQVHVLLFCPIHSLILRWLYRNRIREIIPSSTRCASAFRIPYPSNEQKDLVRSQVGSWIQIMILFAQFIGQIYPGYT